MKNKFIIFAVDHFNPLGVIRSLGEIGILPIVVLYSKHPILVKYSKYIAQLYEVDTIEKGLEVIIKNYSNEDSKTFILATSDDVESVLDQHYDELHDKFYFYNAGEQGRITQMMDKKTICKMGEECGLLIPKTEEVKVGQMPKTLKYPVITKATISTIENWKSNVYICNNEDELKEAYKYIVGEHVLLQEYIMKVDELNIEGFSINNGDDVYMPLQNRFHRVTEDSYGNYLYIDRFSEFDLLKKIKDLFKKTRYNGVFEMEFMIDKDNNYYFLEINFRNSAWLYAYTKCGVNLPFMFAKSMISGSVVKNDEHIKKLPFNVIDELTDFKWSVLSGKVNIFRWIKELFTSDCTFYINRHDMKPFYMYIFNRTVGAIKK